jgi:glucosamine--fructose-6-phosphate aminotransferase (isomerizing)
VPTVATARTHMRQEIEEIPEAVASLLAADPAPLQAAAASVRRARPRLVSIVARGTSDHVAVYARYLFEVYLGLPVHLVAPAVATVYGAELPRRGGVMIAISQSGQGDDAIVMTQRARRMGWPTIAVTNDRDSPLAAAADHPLVCRAGREDAIPATKTYTLALVVIASLLARLAPRSDVARSLPRLPDELTASLDAASGWIDEDDSPTGSPVEAFASDGRALIVSRGYNLATALEVALKLKETSGTFAEAYSSADLLHGPVVLAGAGVPMLVIRPDGRMGRYVDDAIVAAEERGSTPFVIGGLEVADRAHALSLAAALPEALTPIVYALPGQLLAEAVARRRGLNPDQPGGLHKVTRTR